MAEYFFDEDDSKEEIEFKDDLLNYRGYFVENDDEEEKKFYEYGAHFPYKFLYQRLEILVQERKEKQKELEKKLKERHYYGKYNQEEKDSSDYPETTAFTLGKKTEEDGKEKFEFDVESFNFRSRK